MCSHYYGLIPGLPDEPQNRLCHRRHITTIRDSVRWSIGADEGWAEPYVPTTVPSALSYPRTAHLSHTALHYGLPLLPTTSNGHPAQKNVEVWIQYSRALWSDICGQFWNETCCGQFWNKICGLFWNEISGQFSGEICELLWNEMSGKFMRRNLLWTVLKWNLRTVLRWKLWFWKKIASTSASM